jgi:hypothetical protein
MTLPAMIRAIEAMGHVVKRHKDGEVDEWALDLDDSPEDSRGHNGPGCAVCHTSWCKHCWENGEEFPWPIEPCNGAKA